MSRAHSLQAAGRRFPLSLLLVAAIALCATGRAAETVSWSWDCDNADTYSTYISGAQTSNAILGTKATTASDNTYTAVEGTGSNAGRTFMKILPVVPADNEKYHAEHFATITMPITGAATIYENYTLEFDYAPSMGGNKQSQFNFGIAVHDADGAAFFTLFGNRNLESPTIAIYKGADSSAEALWSASQASYSVDRAKDPASEAKWYHFTLSGTSTGGVTLAVTYDGTEILAATKVADTFALPSKVAIRTGVYWNNQLWTCFDGFSFTGKTIYKDKYEQTLDATFESEADVSLLQNGSVANAFFKTTAKTSDSANWTIATGAAAPKNGEKFALLSVKQSTSDLLANMPKEVTKAQEYVVEFDALVQSGYDNTDTNGVAIVGSDRTLATFVNVGGHLYSGGDTIEGSTELATDVKLTGYNNNDPSEKECVWYHYIVRGDEANGVRLTVANLSTGAVIVQDASLGAYDTVRAIALHAYIHGNRTIYAAIDNIKAYTFRKGGLVIIVR